MDDFEEVIAEFLVESTENLDQMERDLVVLEDSPGDKECISSIFRSIHTIKGTCGFLGYDKLERVSHVGENLLSILRDEKGLLTSEVATILLSFVDAARSMLTSIETTGNEGADAHASLVADLERCVGVCQTALANQNASQEQGAAPQDQVQVQIQDKVTEAHLADVPAQPSAGDTPLLEVGLGPVDTLEGMPNPPAGGTQGGEITHAPIMSSTPHAPIMSFTPHARSQAPVHEASELAPREGGKVGRAVDANVRVHVSVLDRLMNLVGELVLARNQILRFADTSQDPALGATIQRLNQVTTELQEGVMTTRMQPIEHVWSKLPRVVRDLARSCSKRVRVEMEGKSTGLDKTLIEAIKDPLTHLVRNAVDHGVETPIDREILGKDPEGTLRLRAFHEGGQVNIEISDDGGGIDPEKVLNKAKEKRLLTAEQAERLSSRQRINLIFMPGLSTAEAVTNVSGRGVGMDVVKTNVERIGGTIEVTSELGVGTTFRIKIPLTLAIVPALIIRMADERYAVPQANLLELIRLEVGDEGSVDEIMGSTVYRLRGQLIPLLFLDRELELDRGHRAEVEVRHVIVLQAGEQRFGLVVDDVHDTEEIVVKPLSKHAKVAGTFAGATIMGDGEVALILDVAGVARHAGIAGHRTIEEEDQTADVTEGELEGTESLLLVEAAQEKWAIPLSRVTRLEEIPCNEVEKVGAVFVVQYRGDIMILTRLGGGTACKTKGNSSVDFGEVLNVIVFESAGLMVGLVVDGIHDIVTERLEIRPVGVRPGVRGTGIVNGVVVEIVDLDAFAPSGNESLGGVEQVA